MHENIINKDVSVDKAVLSIGEKKQRRRRIIKRIALFGSIFIILATVASILWSIYGQPYVQQVQAYNNAQQLLSEGDKRGAILHLTHADTLEPKGNNYFSPQGGMPPYKDSNKLRLQLCREILDEATVGSTVFWGSYEQDGITINGKEALEWRVFDIVDGKMLLLSEHVIDCWPYHTVSEDASWLTSEMRFQIRRNITSRAFNSSEYAAILNTENITKDGDITISTSDKLFLLSDEEVVKYFPLKESRIAHATDYAIMWGAYYHDDHSWWWLRSNGSDKAHFACIHNNGHIYSDGYFIDMDNTAGVRPAMWIDIHTALTFVPKELAPLLP